jgi:hypothetical protein
LWEEKIFGDKNFDLLGGWQFGVGLRLAIPKKFDFFESYLRGTSVEQLLAWILSCYISVNDIQDSWHVDCLHSQPIGNYCHCAAKCFRINDLQRPKA